MISDLIQAFGAQKNFYSQIYSFEQLESYSFERRY